MMTLTETHKSYRISAIQGASPIGLIIVLFDTLAGDPQGVSFGPNDVIVSLEAGNYFE